jgi:hypothetical protein
VSGGGRKMVAAAHPSRFGDLGFTCESFRMLGQNVGANIFAPCGLAHLSTYSWSGFVTNRQSDAYGRNTDQPLDTKV